MPDDAPWIDPVVVPDDIRSLQPDIEAYHRELRRAARRRRLGPLAVLLEWHRIAVPVGIVSGGLLLAGIVTVVLTFGGPRAQPRVPAPAPIASSATAMSEVGQVGGLLPAVDLRTETGALRSAQSWRPALVALVPQHCRCSTLLGDLAGQAGEVQVPLVVVAPLAQDAEVAALSGQLNSDEIVPAYDAGGMLAQIYDASGVTVLVVAPDATVSYIGRDVHAGVRLEGPLLSLLPRSSFADRRP